AADRNLAIQVQLGSLCRAGHFGGAISDLQGRFAAAPRRRRFWRVSTDRSGHDRRSLQPQPAHRAETHREIMQAGSGDRGVTAGKPDASFRRYTAADEDAAIELWRRTWQAAYPHLDFAARLDWWRARWRDELVPSAEIMLAAAGDALVGFVTVDPR